MGQPSIIDFDHEAKLLPNGDTAVIASTQKIINVNGTPTKYNGDMVIVLNQNFQVTWVWNAFHWLNTNRLGYGWRGPERLAARQLRQLVARGRRPDRLPAHPGLGDQDRLRQRDRRRPHHLEVGAGRQFHRHCPPTLARGSPHQHDVDYINDTTLLVFDDGNTRQAYDPRADSRGQEWILNEQNDDGDAGGQCRHGQLLRLPGERADAPQREPGLHVRGS